MQLPPVTTLLAIAIGLLAVNQIVSRVEAFTRVMALYWAVQAVNVAAVVAIAVWGIPGASGYARIINGVLILSISMHLVQNHAALLARRSAERREELEKERAALEIRREQMRGRVGTAERSAPAAQGAPAEEPKNSADAPTEPG